MTDLILTRFATLVCASADRFARGERRREMRFGYVPARLLPAVDPISSSFRHRGPHNRKSTISLTTRRHEGLRFSIVFAELFQSRLAQVILDDVAVAIRQIAELEWEHVAFPDQ